MGEEEQLVSDKPGRHRSPAYPVIDLSTALDKAQVILETGGRQLVPIPVLFQKWGYNTKSGMALRVAAALKQFGLVSDEGSLAQRRFRLTDNAYRILIDKRPDSMEKRGLLQDAALQPTAHKDLWDRYHGQLPVNEHIVYDLCSDGRFTPDAAQDLVDEFRRTIAFAQLEESDSLAADDYSGSDWESQMQSRGTTQVISPQGVPLSDPGLPGSPQNDAPSTDILLAPGLRVGIRASRFLTEDDWTRLFTILGAMKPGFVREERRDED